MTDRIRALLLELAGFAWGQSAICWPSNATIAKDLGKHPDTIRDILAEAEALGFIMRVGESRRTIVLRWKLRSGWALSPTPAQETTTPSQAKAPPESLNQKKGKKKNVAVVGQATQGPPPTDDQKERPALAPRSPSVSQGDESATAEELAEMARQVLGGGPLVSFYRAALALAGITTDEAIRALVESQTPSIEQREFFQPPSFMAKERSQCGPDKQLLSQPKATHSASPALVKSRSSNHHARWRRRMRSESIQHLGEIMPAMLEMTSVSRCNTHQVRFYTNWDR